MGPSPLGPKEMDGLLEPGKASMLLTDYWLTARVLACQGKVVQVNHL